MGLYYSTPQDPLIALIVDKELHARQRLSRLLREIAPEFTGIAEASNDDEAIVKIERFTPNLLFIGCPVSPHLSCQMRDGFALNTPKVVLCKDVKRARPVIEQFGGYYLLKPVDAQHLRDLLDSLNGFRNGSNGNSHAKGNGFKGPKDVLLSRAFLNRLVVRRQSQFRLLAVERVIWFGTEYRLVYAYTEKRRYPIDLGLEQLEQRLDPQIFVRVHRSAIVNVTRILEVIPTAGGRCKIILDEPQHRVLPLSASRARSLKELIQEKIHQ